MTAAWSKIATLQNTSVEPQSESCPISTQELVQYLTSCSVLYAFYCKQIPGDGHTLSYRMLLTPPHSLVVVAKLPGAKSPTSTYHRSSLLAF